MSVFHYTSGQGVKGIFDSNELHCSNVNFMNDPSERTYLIELLKSIGQDSIFCKKIYESLWSDWYNEVVLEVFASFVASFSKNPDSIAMWN